MQKLSLIIALLAMGLGNVWGDQVTWKVSSSATYTQGDELSSNTAIVSVTLGNGTWTYHSGRSGIYVKDQTITRDETTNVPTKGDYIVIKPAVDINFTLSTYASQNNVNLVMVEASAPTTTVKDFRENAHQTNDFGTLKAGKTYYIYGASYKSSGDLDYIFYRGFTAKEMCAAPTFSPIAGELTEATSVTLSTTTTGASIYYTTDGTDPTTSSTLYSSAITVDATKTIKAIAVLDGYVNSEIASATYLFPKTVTFDVGSYGTCATTSLTESGMPGITLPSVTVNNGYYFKGWATTSDATSADAGKRGETYYPISDCTLYAYYKKLDPAIITITDSEGKMVDNKISVLKGKEITLKSTSTPTNGGTIAYVYGISQNNKPYRWCTCKADGSNPTSISSQQGETYTFTASKTGYYCFMTTENVDGTAGYKTTYSDVITVEVENVLKPTLSLSSGTYIGSQKVTITNNQDGAAVYYTTDGTTPSSSSTAYTAGTEIEISATTTLKAVAIYDGSVSDAVSATYTIYTTTDLGTIKSETGTGTAKVTTWDFSAITTSQMASMAAETMGHWTTKSTGYYSSPVVTEESYWSPTWCDGIQLGLNQAATSGGKAQIFESTQTNKGYYLYGGAASIKVTMPEGSNTIVVTSAVPVTSNTSGVTFSKNSDGTYSAIAVAGTVVEIHRSSNASGSITKVETKYVSATVTATATPEGYGTVTMTDGDGNTLTSPATVGVGTKVTFTATPATGYQFVKWTDDEEEDVTTNLNYTTTVTGDLTMTANFTAMATNTVTANDVTVEQNQTDVKLTAVATANNGGKLSYQWYTCNAEGTNEAAITGATSAEYPVAEDLSTVGTTYYYKVKSVEDCSSTAGMTSVTTTSDVITLKVVAVAINFADASYSVDIADWNPVFPEATTSTDAANIKWTGTDNQVAIVEESSTSKTGTIRVTGSGTMTVTAQLNLEGNNDQSSYELNVIGEPAEMTVSGYSCTMSTVGRIEEQRVTEVPRITLNYSNGTGTSVIREWNSKKVSLTIDDNGYFTVTRTNTTGLPTKGSFYVFTPAASGTLTIKGYGYTANTVVEMLDASGTAIAATGGATSFTCTDNATEYTQTYSLQKDQTYYLTAENAKAFLLSGYTFEAKLHWKDGIAATRPATGTTTFTQEADGYTGVTYWAKAKGGVTSASISDGVVTWTGDGGAVIVYARDSYDGSIIHYVINVPYATNTAHTWTFTNELITEMREEQLDDATKYDKTEYSLNYKIRSRSATTKDLKYINVPVITASTAVVQDNAYYIPCTAGLMFDAKAKYFGAVVSSFSKEVDYTGCVTEADKLKAQVNRPCTDVSGASPVTFAAGTVITIPNLTEGQHVRVKWVRYAQNSGDKFTATNLKDLDGTEITDYFEVGNFASGNGYDEFIVKADGDVTFTLQNGWTNIREIQVGTVAQGFIDTDMRIKEFKNSKKITLNAADDTYTKTLSTKYGNVLTMSALSTEYYIKDGSATEGITASITTAGALTVTASKNGTFTILQKAKSNGYVLDMNETEITVTIQADTKQSYPYTWDFKKVSDATKNLLATNSATDDGDMIWIDHSADGYYGLMVDDMSFIQGSDLYAGETTLPEFEGLGITTYASANNNNQIRLHTDGKGLEFARISGSDKTCTMTIPEVPEGYKVYIHARFTSSERLRTFNVTGGTLSQYGNDFGEKYGSSPSEKIFVIDDCDGSDVVVTLRNYIIKAIGVTKTFKTFQVYEGASYATDCQAHNIRYDMTSELTAGDSPVTAKIVTGTTSGNSAEMKTIEVAPAGTGTILTCASTEDITDVPLFVRDVNTAESDVTGNMLVGILPETNASLKSVHSDASHTYYIFTRSYYEVDDNDNKISGKKTGPLAFYRVMTTSTSTIADNKAYLKLDVGDPHAKSSAKATAIYFVGIEDEPDPVTPTEITTVEEDSLGNDASIKIYEDAVVYNLQGVRVQNPHHGIYIVNGKKVYIK